MLALSVYVAIVIILAGIRKFQESKWLKCLNNIKLSNKIVIVTGANSGIGYEITKELAKREAEVVLACRNVQAAQEAIYKIKQIYPKANLVPLELDLSSLKSIKSFIEEVSRRYMHIDILINNAGVSYPPSCNKKTKNGFEIHMGVNHLGHFYLTTRLLHKLEEVEQSRIVVITSKLHEKGVIDVEDLNNEKKQSSTLYANSKLANAYFSRELSKRTKVNTYACCPGWVYTNLFRHHSIPWYKYIFILPIAWLFLRSPEQGAQTPIYCATEPNLLSESGYMYRDCQKYKSRVNFDDEVSRKLWEKSEEMIEDKIKELND
ncbi:retinol dehydrogenase 11 [Agrilus planipennis]|uniref:Retinol dehydrogenase 11 n=1 Tax=Agrilus planipennis TaxID=224129 RepID=A0A1W4XJ42_AGRPL|nr:retinol dehydrogenase 11 [Agrilus planipennis]